MQKESKTDFISACASNIFMNLSFCDSAMQSVHDAAYRLLERNQFTGKIDSENLDELIYKLAALKSQIETTLEYAEVVKEDAEEREE
ncbi:MAG: hypothetical protein IJU03_10285 [Thermoguttaceae bacterium]|nr:hypothetical protein [Thermoguttaceae bacterium]